MPVTILSFFPLNNLMQKLYSGKNINIKLENIPPSKDRLIIKNQINFQKLYMLLEIAIFIIFIHYLKN